MYTFKRNEIVILLGAGASVDAGVPHSTEMVNRVEALVALGNTWADFYHLYYYVRSAIHYADGVKGKIGDAVLYNIERLVDVLDELSKRDEHTLYPFVGAWNLKLLEVAGANFEQVQRLRKNIVEILRAEWVEIEHYEKASYYKGLVEFRREYQHPLRIFTLNYDLCVEKACEKVLHKFPERGFENRLWDWRLFEDLPNDPKDIFLYKLHGSTDWKRNHDGTITYTDSPSSISSSEVAIIFGTSYKLQYDEPFLFLAYEFRKWTLDSKLIIAIGYGFGDEHINAILRQALNNNATTKLLSVTPLCAASGSSDSPNCPEVSRIEKLLQLNQPGTGQVDHQNYSAKDFMNSYLSIEQLASLFPDEEPELFPAT
ncbi:MAG: hypothetical protein DDT33_00763 [Firmicutes bacterium]|nr:hypothetical protein [Bacillota bacterium]